MTRFGFSLVAPCLSPLLSSFQPPSSPRLTQPPSFMYTYLPPPSFRKLSPHISPFLHITPFLPPSHPSLPSSLASSSSPLPGIASGSLSQVPQTPRLKRIKSGKNERERNEKVKLYLKKTNPSQFPNAAAMSLSRCI